MVTETDCLFSVFPFACGNFTSMVSNCFASVEAIIKKINNKKTTSVIEDMLNSGVILFRPRKFIYTAGSFNKSKKAKEVASI